jgi:hypothetical protein
VQRETWDTLLVSSEEAMSAWLSLPRPDLRHDSALTPLRLDARREPLRDRVVGQVCAQVCQGQPSPGVKVKTLQP